MFDGLLSSEERAEVIGGPGDAVPVVPVVDPGQPAVTALDWDDARALAHSVLKPLSPASVPLTQSQGLVLARPLVALTSLPPFDCSAMDGYAVRGRPPWTVDGGVRAGERPPDGLRPGHAREVATGAPLPTGATDVLPYERASRLGSRVTGQLPRRPQVRRSGEECGPGEELLPAGSYLSPQAVGLAAAVGHDRLWVRPRPTVCALVTGDEIRAEGVPRDGWIRDAIGPALPGLVEYAGGSMTSLRTVPDDEPTLTAVLSAATGPVVLVSGSTARGPADHLRAAIRTLGGRSLIDAVCCRPGHPQCLFQLPDGRLVIGLPGNPLAALVAFLTLAEPVLSSLQGLGLSEPVAASAPELGPHRTDTTLVPVCVRDGAVTAVRHTGSAMLRGLAVADALAVVAPASRPPGVRLLRLPTRAGPAPAAPVAADQTPPLTRARGAGHG
jgi:molybdopterin molybdotransferase